MPTVSLFHHRRSNAVCYGAFAAMESSLAARRSENFLQVFRVQPVSSPLDSSSTRPKHRSKHIGCCRKMLNRRRLLLDCAAMDSSTSAPPFVACRAFKREEFLAGEEA